MAIPVPSRLAVPGSFESFPYFTTGVTFAASGANENVALLPSSTPVAASRLLCQKLVAVR
ncbi:hypothetical protein NXY01_15910 [Bacteroides fragilis]|nr:hypothetical protein NXY01_15910 [Bacteroides fragilis]